jgi:hypothetical protein
MIVIPYRGSTFTKDMPQEQKIKILESAATFLYPKKYHVIKMLKGMALDGEQMSTSEIVKYLYSVYNPAATINLEGVPPIYI